MSEPAVGSPDPVGIPIPADAAALAAASAQLGREVRGVHAVAHRCSCGLPDVLITQPRLPDGRPFPTLYYLTCPRATAAISTLESEGVMAAMAQRLAVDAELAATYRSAHDSYLADRAALGDDPRVAGVSAGGMPTRVKCLHVLAAHALAAGPGINPLGDEALQLLAERGITPASSWGRPGPCVTPA